MHELQSQLVVESTIVEQAFRQHMDAAIDIFLNDSQNYYDHLARLRSTDQPDDLAAVTARQGLWPVRLAIETLDGHDFTIQYAPEVEEETELPPYMPQRIDRDKQLQIEALGCALLDEAFEVLGDDAAEYVEKYKNAQTEDERNDAYAWLARRLSDIKQVKEEVLNDDERQQRVNDPNDPLYQYHPAQLSPKFIGKWPNIQTYPTCLAVSILAASFFYKTGEPLLHAGVVRTAGEDSKEVVAQIVTEIEKVAKKNSIDIGDRFEGFIDSFDIEYNRMKNWDIGFHAALLSPMFDGKWVQSDSNYDLDITLPPAVSQKAQETYDLLKALEPTAKGVETLIMNRNTLSHRYFYHLVEELGENLMPVEDAERLLLNMPDTVNVYKFARASLDFLYSPVDDEGMGIIKDQIERMAKYYYDKSYEEYLDDVGESLLMYYVFADGDNDKKDISKCIARCKTDASYLRRRAEDLIMLPLYTAAYIAADYTNATVSKHMARGHAFFEVGLPEYRIGASVLSDLAVMLGSELPSAFWLSYWPSHISLAEHANKLSYSPGQNELIKQVAEHIAAIGFTYYPVDGIIEGILE